MPKRERYEVEWKMHDHEHCHCWRCHRGGGAVYGLGFIGALVYYLQNISGFWNVVLAILKALVWPALLVYHLLGL